MIRIARSDTVIGEKIEKRKLHLHTVQHINDVRKVLSYFKDRLDRSAAAHDKDKISGLKRFHSAFEAGGSAFTTWFNTHRVRNRHHLEYKDGIPVDVDLIDVLDYIADCVVAGISRKGSVYPLNLPLETLQRAFNNTVTNLKADGIREEE